MNFCCAFCLKTEDLIDTVKNSILIDNKCYEFKAIFRELSLLQVLSISDDSCYVCESCKDHLVQFFLFKRNIKVGKNPFKKILSSQVEDFLENINNDDLQNIKVIRTINSITLQLDKEENDYKFEKSDIIIEEKEEVEVEDDDDNIAYEASLIGEFFNCTRCGKEIIDNEDVHQFLKHSSFGAQLSLEIENSKVFIEDEMQSDVFYICSFCNSHHENSDLLLIHLLNYHNPDIAFQVNESLNAHTHLMDFNVINGYINFIKECLLYKDDEQQQQQVMIDDNCRKYFFEIYGELDCTISEKDIVEEEMDLNDGDDDGNENIQNIEVHEEINKERRNPVEVDTHDKAWLRQEISRSKFVINTETGEKRVGYRCSLTDQCNHISNSASGLRYHLMMKHLKNRDDYQERRQRGGVVGSENNNNQSTFHFTSKSKNCCNECNMKFKDSRALQLHEKCHELFSVIAQHSIFPACNTCNQKFLTESLLQQHLVKHDDNEEDLSKAIEVSDIGAIRQQGKIINSAYTSIGETNDIEYAWKCGHCSDKYFSKEEHLNLHILMIHTTNFICPGCKMNFSGFKCVSLFIHHLRNKHPELFPSSFLSFACTFCNTQFSNNYDKLTHMKNCDKKQFACDHCNKKFYSKSSLLNHLKIYVTGEIQYQCAICQKTCLSASDLKIHHRSHSKIKPYKCSICSKSFRTLAARSSHVEGHNTNLVFLCEICNKSYKQRQLYRRHMKANHETKTM